MPHRLIKPNHFLFDFVVIFIFVGLPLWILATIFVHFPMSVPYSHLWPTCLTITLTLTIPWTIWSQISQRKNPRSEFVFTEEDVEAEIRRKEEEKQEEIHARDAHFQASLRRANEDFNRNKTLREMRQTEIGALEAELQHLKTVHYGVDSDGDIAE